MDPSTMARIAAIASPGVARRIVSEQGADAARNLAAAYNPHGSGLPYLDGVQHTAMPEVRRG